MRFSSYFTHPKYLQVPSRQRVTIFNNYMSHKLQKNSEILGVSKYFFQRSDVNMEYIPVPSLPNVKLLINNYSHKIVDKIQIFFKFCTSWSTISGTQGIFQDFSKIVTCKAQEVAVGQQTQVRYEMEDIGLLLRYHRKSIVVGKID